MNKYYTNFFGKKLVLLLIAVLMVRSVSYSQVQLTPYGETVSGGSDISSVRRSDISDEEMLSVDKKGDHLSADRTLTKNSTKSASSCVGVIFGGTDGYYYGGEDASQYGASDIYYNYSHHQFIIKRTEMAGYYNASCGATIYKISFFISDSYGRVGASFTRQWTISMGHTNNTQYNNNTFLTGLTTVFSTGNITFSGEGWFDITLTTPFVYNGTQNLVIDVKDNTGTCISSSYPIFASVFNTSTAINWSTDYSSSSNSSTGSRSSYRPYCKLCISPRSNLTYNTNGNGNCGTGTSIPSVSCVDDVTLPNTIPSCGGGTFAFWSQYPDGYGSQYSPGETVSMPASDVTLYAIYHGTLTYNTTYNCSGGGSATTIAPVEDRQVAHVTSVIPTCSTSGSFRYWNTAPDGSGTTYEAGDEIRLDCMGDVTLYAIYCNEPYQVSINGCNHQTGDPEGEPCYIDVCLNTPGSHNVTLTASSDMPSPTYRWSVNRHDGNGYTYTNGNNQTVTITGTDLVGYDVQVTAQSPEGCKATLNGRIRTSNGLHAEVPSTLPHICAGSGRTLTIGTVGTDIIIDEPAVHIEANLGQGVQTFIPDGPNCTDLGQCYTSQVEFVDFDPDAVVDLVSDINYLRINLEHTHIGDMQIKLICPNGQSSIILEDSYGIANGGLDEYQYDWMYTNILFWASYRVYTNTAGDGGCVQGAYQGTADMRTYVVYDGSTYSTTGVRQEASSFPINASVATLLTHLRAARNSGNTPASFCRGNYYYVFDSWRQSATDFTTSTFDDNGLSDYLVHWGLDNASLGFGMPNPLDGLLAGDECDVAHNSAGTGLDYCWSNNPDYSYAGGAHGWVRETANHQTGTTIGTVVIPSNMDNMSQIYHPFQDFSNLIGCPLNGTWTVQVCDSWALDNGYIFDWSLALSDDKLPNAWSYGIVTAGSELNCETGSITHFIDPNDYSVEMDPQPGESGTGCSITITDNIGCQTTVDLPLVIDEATITPAGGNLDEIEVCKGGSITSGNSWTLGGVATGATISWQLNGSDITGNPAGITFNVSGNTVTLSGSNVTATPGAYTYTISTVQGSTGCDPVTAIGTIIVNPQPVVSVSALLDNECPGGQTVTVTGSLATEGTAPYTYTWNVGGLTVATGSSATITGSTSIVPTVDVVIPTTPCNTNYPIGLMVTDAKGCNYTFSPANVITVQDNGGPTLRSGEIWPPNQTGNIENYPGVAEILTRVPTAAQIAALYEDDCTSPVNVTQGSPILDSTVDCGWGVRIPYTISDDCNPGFTEYINVTGGRNDFINAPPRDSTVMCPSQLPTEQQMAALVPEINICGITRTVTLDSIRDNIDQSCGSRIYYYHYLDANNDPYVWTFTFNLEHTSGPTEQGTHVSNTRSVACITEAEEPTVMPQIRDACGNLLQPVSSTTEEYLNNCNGYRKYIYNYVDCAGLDTTWTFTYTIHDSIPPTINTIAQQDAISAGNCQYKMPDLRPLVEATDNCGGTVTFVSQSPDTNARFNPGGTARNETVTITVMDACGNPATRTVQVHIPANTLNVTASNDVSICPTGSTTLTAQSNDATSTYTWSPATWLSGTNGSQVTATPSATITYTVVATSSAGCHDTDDVTVTIDPTVRQTYGVQTVSACDSYPWINGQTYTSSTNTPTYLFHNGNAAGCDSTVTLHLTIHNSVRVESFEHHCDQYTSQGVTYTEDADFVQELRSQWDCDSIVTMHLKIHPSYQFEDSTSICTGETYEYHGENYSSAGVFSRNFQSIYECDSVYTLTLEVLPRLSVSIDTAIDCINGWYEMWLESNAEFYHWTSKPQPGNVSSIAMYRYTDEGYDSVIHMAPDRPTYYYVTVGYDENLRCPQTDSIAVDEFIMPVADFDVNPAHVTADMPRWYAKYEVSGDRSYVTREWYVDHELYDQQSQHIYGDYDLRSGNDSVIIELIAHGKFCSDTMHIAIPYLQESLYVPNVFTPGLETNNLFGAEGTGILEFEMWVFSREGLVVFHGTSLDEKWDGTHNGADCPMSSYTYRINYKLERVPNSYQSKVGTVMIIR